MRSSAGSSEPAGDGALLAPNRGRCRSSCESGRQAIIAPGEYGLATGMACVPHLLQRPGLAVRDDGRIPLGRLQLLLLGAGLARLRAPAGALPLTSWNIGKNWRTRHDSNVRPSPSEGDALSS